MRLERYTRAIAAIRLFPRRGLSHLYLCMPIARVSRAAVHFSLAAAVRSRASVEDVRNVPGSSRQYIIGSLLAVIHRYILSCPDTALTIMSTH